MIFFQFVGTGGYMDIGEYDDFASTATGKSVGWCFVLASL
eukprot:CAMPEP_0180671856 /NCGR_PEP_ID=MMETSP1037_2-20121125/64814_1 /TAXON_ID=632150 /ORGANISM="Azadinium spinosum, Strain 3D9" /LENGTH=39 /DNA_ID= /DNA_START= /DNA_END= /DNA_ORIENTATION=